MIPVYVSPLWSQFMCPHYDPSSWVPTFKSAVVPSAWTPTLRHIWFSHTQWWSSLPVLVSWSHTGYLQHRKEKKQQHRMVMIASVVESHGKSKWIIGYEMSSWYINMQCHFACSPQLLLYITFAVGIRHGDDILLIPAEKMQPGFAVQDGRQRVTCKWKRGKRRHLSVLTHCALSSWVDNTAAC